ncbi:MAG: phosphate ABC transporter permease subunit PstC [Rhodobacteraceae bacterium]|nr:phosphate ABC transporter permease subunit PstC [Paracoccaceae bacterium]
MTTAAFALLLLATVGACLVNRRAALAIRGRGARLHSLAGFHGAYAGLLVAVPTAVLVLLWLLLEGPVIDRLVLAGLPGAALAGLDAGGRDLVLAEIHQLALGHRFGTPAPHALEAAARLVRLREAAGLLLLLAVLATAATLAFLARARVRADFRARPRAERIIAGLMVFASAVAVLTTLGIVASLVVETGRFFALVPWTDFLFGTRWEPQIAIRADQIAGAGAFGVLPVFLGTLVVTAVALAVAVPVGLFAAIYLAEFASPAGRRRMKPVLEILAGVPTVVYGFFAILTVAPALRDLGALTGLAVAPNTALAAGIVMGVMLVPFISSFADDALAAVPRALRDGALALGATRAEAVTGVLVPAALPGIMGGILLAVSRAVGETMIVVMAAGLIARMTVNPLDSVTTVTVQIVSLLVGDTAFDSPKTLAAFALGMLLFAVTLALNVLALAIVRRYREAYD